METITFKLQENVLQKIDRILRPLNFNTRTEFIREAIRDKLNKVETEKFMKKLVKYKGTAKVHVSDERLHEIRDEVAKEYAKKFGVNLN
jgi:metal-responsive CopG/Arc/MetJ family transcriptional regulator